MMMKNMHPLSTQGAPPQQEAPSHPHLKTHTKPPQKRVRQPKVFLKSLRGISPKLLDGLQQFGLTYLHELLALEKNRAGKKSLAKALGASHMDIDVLLFFAFSVHRKLSDLCYNLQGVHLTLVDDAGPSITPLEAPLEMPNKGLPTAEDPRQHEKPARKAMYLPPPHTLLHGLNEGGLDFDDPPVRSERPRTVMFRV
jgi:hypothetical protein